MTQLSTGSDKQMAKHEGEGIFLSVSVTTLTQVNGTNLPRYFKFY